MATETTSIGDKPLKIFYEGQEHELIIRVREGSPALNEVVMNNLIRETLKAWMYAWKGATTLAAVDGYLSADDNCDIAPSTNEPYVTVFNKTYDGLSITVHDSTRPWHAVRLVKAYRDAIAIVQEKSPALFEAPKTEPSKLDPDSYFGGKPETPATNIIPLQTELQKYNDNHARRDDDPETVAFRASKLVGNDYMIESGKRDSVAWKEVTKATKPYNRDKVEHSDGELVAYMVNAPMVVKAPNGKTCMEVQTSGGKFTFWQSKRDSDEATFDWQSIETQMYGVNVLAEQLTDGFKLNMPCLLIVKFTHSGGKEYANFYGFRALPQKQVIAS